MERILNFFIFGRLYFVIFWLCYICICILKVELVKIYGKNYKRVNWSFVSVVCEVFVVIVVEVLK